MRKFFYSALLSVSVVFGSFAQSANPEILAGGFLPLIGDPLFVGFSTDEATFGTMSEKTPKILHSVEFVTEKASFIKEIFYPVWTDERILFMARNDNGAYCFLEYIIGSGDNLLRELKLKSSSGDPILDASDDGFLSSEKPDEPPLYNPVANPDTGELAFLLYEGDRWESVSVCMMDPAKDGTVKKLFQAPKNTVLRSLSWKDKTTLIYTIKPDDAECELYSLDVISSKATLSAKGYIKPVAAYGKGIIAAISDSGDSPVLVILDKQFKPKETALKGELSRLSWDPTGRFVAAILGMGRNAKLMIWDSVSAKPIEVKSNAAIFFEEVGTIYNDYVPVWDGKGNVYFTTKGEGYELTTRIYKFNPSTLDNRLVYDFSDLNITTISSFAVSDFNEYPDGRQLVISTLKDRSSSVRVAQLYFFNKALGE